MRWPVNKTIVVPVDFTPESMDAVKMAEQLSIDEQEIHVIHVIPHLEPVSYPAIAPRKTDVSTRKTEVKKKLIQFLSESASDAVSLEIRSGDPGTGIVDFADEIDAGLIVIPSHGRSGLKRVFLGSVAERVIRNSHCPVLVLRKERVDSAPKLQHESRRTTPKQQSVDELLEVFSTDDANFAELLKNSLQAAGMKCEIDGEHQAGFVGLNSFPVKLLVRAEDFDQALKYIQSHDPK